MRLNKKGFTLIELLAVIVILAIIALIATPMILGVIDKAKKGAVESSALGYIDAVEKEAVIGMLDNAAGVGALAIPEGIYDVKADKVTGKALAGVTVKGQEPSEGWIAINNEGEVVAASLKFDSYGSHVGYTVEDRAKAKLSSAVAKPTAAEAGKTLIQTAIDAVHAELIK